LTRITVDVNDEWLEAARGELGTDTKVATINEALRVLAERRKAREVIAAFDRIGDLDYTASGESFGRFGGGRDLSRPEESARLDRSA
jgi:hypothetical protein